MMGTNNTTNQTNSTTTTSSSSSTVSEFALGTGLAESRNDNCVTNNNDTPSKATASASSSTHHDSRRRLQEEPSQHSTTTTATAAAATTTTMNAANNITTMNRKNNDRVQTNYYATMGLPAPTITRTHTPDTYARQSRHSMNRLLGCTSMATTAASASSSTTTTWTMDDTLGSLGRMMLSFPEEERNREKKYTTTLENKNPWSSSSSSSPPSSTTSSSWVVRQPQSSSTLQDSTFPLNYHTTHTLLGTDHHYNNNNNNVNNNNHDERLHGSYIENNSTNNIMDASSNNNYDHRYHLGKNAQDESSSLVLSSNHETSAAESSSTSGSRSRHNQVNVQDDTNNSIRCDEQYSNNGSKSHLHCDSHHYHHHYQQQQQQQQQQSTSTLFSTGEKKNMKTSSTGESIPMTEQHFTAAVMAENVLGRDRGTSTVNGSGGTTCGGESNNVGIHGSSSDLHNNWASRIADTTTTTTTTTDRQAMGGVTMDGIPLTIHNNHIYNKHPSVVGLTVVEPSSSRNSPALVQQHNHLPFPHGGSNDNNNKSTLGIVENTTTLAPPPPPPPGMRIINDKGSFYQSWQQQLQKRFMLSPSVVVVGGGGIGGGGRASAPPAQPQFLPSVLTVGGVGGGFIVSGGGAGGGCGVIGSSTSRSSTPESGMKNHCSSGGSSHTNLRSLTSTPVVGTIVSVTPLPDPGSGSGSTTASTAAALHTSGHNNNGHILIPKEYHSHPHSSFTEKGGRKEEVAAQSLMTITHDRVKREMELAAVRDLAPFLLGIAVGDDTTTTASSCSGSSTTSNHSSSITSNPGSTSTRGLAILHASSLRCQDVRSTCEAFGALETFRSDFGESRGVFFVTYYDLRNAQLAAVELPKVLNQFGSNGLSGGGGGGGGVVVKYCVPLNSANATDESMLLLSNLPGSVDEGELSQLLSSFGQVRAIHYQANATSHSSCGEDGRWNESASYLVEFYDVQDAKQALLELEQIHPWGITAKIEVGTRSPAKRKLGKELILLLSNWRQDKCGASLQKDLLPHEVQRGNSLGFTSSNENSVQSSPQSHDPSTRDGTRSNYDDIHCHSYLRAGDIYTPSNPMPVGDLPPHSSHHSHYSYAQNPGNTQPYQLVIGPDGQYSYVLVNNNCPQMFGPPYGHVGQPVIFDHDAGSQHHQRAVYGPGVEHQYMHSPNQRFSQVAPQQYQIQYNAPAMLLQQSGMEYGLQDMVHLDTISNGLHPPTQFIRMPSNEASSLFNNGGLVLGGTGGHSAASSGSGSHSENHSGGASNSRNQDDEGDNRANLTLTIDDVCTGKDRRSSLMVRNIPNKYTQQMLLTEFAAAGHGPDKIDFFYLPIDFKNKCNRGYAFVNFVNYKDIIPFLNDYNHRGWKRFNSDKICDIAYARIQGKAAMCKRFENSALMAKEDEYRPLVFVSHGERKGQVETLLPAMTANIDL